LKPKAAKVVTKAFAELDVTLSHDSRKYDNPPESYHTQTRYSLKTQSAVNGKSRKNAIDQQMETSTVMSYHLATQNLDMYAVN
jgi:hypothetical protein